MTDPNYSDPYDAGCNSRKKKVNLEVGKTLRGAGLAVASEDGEGFRTAAVAVSEALKGRMPNPRRLFLEPVVPAMERGSITPALALQLLDDSGRIETGADRKRLLEAHHLVVLPGKVMIRPDPRDYVNTLRDYSKFKFEESQKRVAASDIRRELRERSIRIPDVSEAQRYEEDLMPLKPEAALAAVTSRSKRKARESIRQVAVTLQCLEDAREYKLPAARKRAESATKVERLVRQQARAAKQSGTRFQENVCAETELELSEQTKHVRRSKSTKVVSFAAKTRDTFKSDRDVERQQKFFKSKHGRRMTEAEVLEYVHGEFDARGENLVGASLNGAHGEFGGPCYMSEESPRSEASLETDSSDEGSVRQEVALDSDVEDLLGGPSARKVPLSVCGEKNCAHKRGSLVCKECDRQRKDWDKRAEKAALREKRVSVRAPAVLAVAPVPAQRLPVAPSHAQACQCEEFCKDCGGEKPKQKTAFEKIPTDLAGGFQGTLSYNWVSRAGQIDDIEQAPTDVRLWLGGSYVNPASEKKPLTIRHVAEAVTVPLVAMVLSPFAPMHLGPVVLAASAASAVYRLRPRVHRDYFSKEVEIGRIDLKPMPVVAPTGDQRAYHAREVSLKANEAPMVGELQLLTVNRHSWWERLTFSDREQFTYRTYPLATDMRRVLASYAKMSGDLKASMVTSLARDNRCLDLNRHQEDRREGADNSLIYMGMANHAVSHNYVGMSYLKAK